MSGAPNAAGARRLPERIYTADSELRRPGALARAMLADLGASRHVAWRLFVRDLRAQYRQTALGYLWALGTPVASALLFIFLRSRAVLAVGEIGVPYPVFVLASLIFWEAFSTALAAPLAVATAAAPVLGKLAFPREALLLSGVLQVGFGLLLRLLLLAPVLAYYGVAPPASALLVPVGLVALVVLGLALGVLILPFGLLYQDVARAVPIVSLAWMLLTPVVYAPGAVAGTGAVRNWNPVSPLVITTRELLLGAPLSEPRLFLLVGALA
ncbi:MAG: ABC transporter permease, partial [Myxococcota bacterium]